MTDHTDVFLSHNWGNDEYDRDNHQHVSLIDEELKARGYKYGLMRKTLGEILMWKWQKGLSNHWA